MRPSVLQNERLNLIPSYLLITQGIILKGHYRCAIPITNDVIPLTYFHKRAFYQFVFYEYLITNISQLLLRLRVKNPFEYIMNTATKMISITLETWNAPLIFLKLLFAFPFVNYIAVL